MKWHHNDCLNGEKACNEKKGGGRLAKSSQPSGAHGLEHLAEFLQVGLIE
jgi:hypothetical protein